MTRSLRSTGMTPLQRYKETDAPPQLDSDDAAMTYEIVWGFSCQGVSARRRLEAVAIESKRTIDIDEFVPKDEIDELYLNNPYYIAPDGEVGQQAFAVIREAIRKEGMVAIGKDGRHFSRATT